MASGVTNKGKFRLAEQALANGAEPTNLYVALVTSAVVPTALTNTFGQLTEIAAGNGYTSGGIALARNATNFPTVEDDTNNRMECDIPDQTWAAGAGPIPASGAGARYAVLTDDNVTIANREVYAWWDLISDRAVSVGQNLTLQNMLLRFT